MTLILSILGNRGPNCALLNNSKQEFYLSLFNLFVFTLATINYLFYPALFAQEFHFERIINPFPVLDENGLPFEHSFTGGMNRPVQQLVDIDGDSDPDLFVQENESNRLILFRNIGTPTEFQFEWATDRFEDLELGVWFKFADVDNDGDFDLFAEKPFGNIQYFRNDGSATTPNFVIATDTLWDNVGNPITVGGFSVPEWADLNGDNNLDLFIGNILDGSITYYQNIGSGPNAIPIFEFVSSMFEGLQIITGGAAKTMSSPSPDIESQHHGANSLTFVDIDNDQDNDLFWGDFFWGGLIYLPNQGTNEDPQFDMNDIVENYPPTSPLSTGGFNVPRFTDIDTDGDFDMFIGVLGGFISAISDSKDNFYFYENTGSPVEPNFVLRAKQLINTLDIGYNTIPTLVDIDNDNDFDLFLANEIDLNSPETSNSRLYFFENQGSKTNPSFSLVDSHYLNYDRPIFDANYSPTFVDIDDDNDKDLFLGRWEGKLTFYLNEGSAGSPNFVRVDENYADIDIGLNSMPAFVDIDDDNDFDLFIGELSQNISFGRINFYRNIGSHENPSFDLVTTNYFDIDLGVGEFLYPSFTDIDNDQDWDLVIGTQTKGIVIYRNIGTAQSANFIPDSSFQLIDRIRTSPNLEDIDNDGDLDLISGSAGGGLIYYENTSVTSAIKSSDQFPHSYSVTNNYPNPFNNRTIFNVTIPYENELKIVIYNIAGKKIKTILNNEMGRGTHSFEWNGNSDHGAAVSSGVYILQVLFDSFSHSQKIILIK
jgi:hypothetical protein